jgi:uncharacterized DUF497 family protein
MTAHYKRVRVAYVIRPWEAAGFAVHGFSSRDGNVQLIAEHGVTVEEVEDVLFDPITRTGRSRRSGRPQAFGSTSTGKFITVIWEEVTDDPWTIYPVTAYEVPPPQGRQR